jgi:hypothetical protein
MATGLQASEVFGINFRPLTLAIRTIIPADVRALIPIETQPFQPVINNLMSLRRITFLIRIFNPENKPPSISAGVEPVEKSRASASHMKITSR